MTTPQMDHKSDEFSEVPVFERDIFPIEPGNLVVMAVGVVVASLRAADLVAGEQHRDPERQQQGGDQVALLEFAQGSDSGI